tara:strand:+ start:201 stop:320 length:120 start_codon:yes stop_codon:yes gene_type:complete
LPPFNIKKINEMSINIIINNETDDPTSIDSGITENKNRK